MGFVEVFFVGIGLSMDAFAVSVCKGLSMKKEKLKKSLLIACFFGFFQAFMPFIGWLLGYGFEKYITAFDHWIVFVILVVLGTKMMLESLKKNANVCPVETETQDRGEIRQIFMLSVATSIDALAVGITFAFLKVKILSSCFIIGITTWCLSFVGIYIGSRCGSHFKRKAEFAGGVILILLGIKILFEHLHIL